MIHRSNLYYSKIYQKGNWRKNIQFPLEQIKMQPPRHLTQLSIWRGWLGILDIDTKSNCIKIKWIERLLNPTNALWKGLMLYLLKIILNSDQALALFIHKQVLTGLLVTKIYKNRTRKILYSITLLLATFNQ